MLCDNSRKGQDVQAQGWGQAPYFEGEKRPSEVGEKGWADLGEVSQIMVQSLGFIVRAMAARVGF